MKTILAVIGAILITAVVLIVGGSYYVYHKSSTMVVTLMEAEIPKFISQKHPPEPVANSLLRILNGVKLHPSWTKTALLSSTMGIMQSGHVTDDQAKMLEAAAVLAEKPDLSRQELVDFTRQYPSQAPMVTPNQRN